MNENRLATLYAWNLAVCLFQSEDFKRANGTEMEYSKRRVQLWSLGFETTVAVAHGG